MTRKVQAVVDIAPLLLEVRTLPKDDTAGASLAVEVPADELVGAFKRRVCRLHSAEGWDAVNMNIILQGRFLADEQTLADCGVHHGDFLVATGMLPYQASSAAHSFVPSLQQSVGDSPRLLHEGTPVAQELERA
eukprot:CAMPEP_0183350716 /NCGR_PEP_ID=MMETSP0164_2-20130417/20739_1 /TAXON_ID=221442 /ORGANISM="Coccolithus pelagicus ssp braarudi, Strain PLY182g" /LENGTH=133 /DNA_ID=CAMNT_0025522693 /DNA_START=8 /DNA_END=409 /DNA_ORIENTATION=-